MKENQKYDLFISYRRNGGVDYARMIYLELKRRGYHTFFDYNSLRDGKFNEEIFRAIDECHYFILVLTNGSLERCQDERDWVRREIEYALSKGKRIIPICPAGNVRAFPEWMPPHFESLRLQQISPLQTDDLFEKSIDKIVEDRFDTAFRNAHRPIGVSTKVLCLAVAVLVVSVVMIALAVKRGCSSGEAVMDKAEIDKASRLVAENVVKDVMPRLHYSCMNCGAFTIETGAKKPDPTGCKGGGKHKWMYLAHVGDEKYRCMDCGKVLMTASGLPMDAAIGAIEDEVSRISESIQLPGQPRKQTKKKVAGGCAETHRHKWEKIDE